MRVILQESLDHLGSIGDVINVKDGYARNYLIPRGKAVVATDGELKRFEARHAKIATEKAKILEAARAQGDALSKVILATEVRISDEGQLYGSVGVSDIADLLAKKGFVVEKKQILLPEPIKAVGSYVIPIRIHSEVTVEIHLNVTKEAAD